MCVCARVCVCVCVYTPVLCCAIRLKIKACYYRCFDIWGKLRGPQTPDHSFPCPLCFHGLCLSNRHHEDRSQNLLIPKEWANSLPAQITLRQADYTLQPTLLNHKARLPQPLLILPAPRCPLHAIPHAIRCPPLPSCEYM